jgi:MFS family permease
MGLISSSWEHSRIVVLAAHCLLTSINSFQWANYFPVPDQAQTVFGMNLSQVNVLLLVYTVVWLPIMPMSVPLQQATGPYGPLIVGSALNLLAAVVKLMSLFWFPAFAPAVIAQALAGAGEVFFLPLPALIASTWFPTKMRTVATACASLANSVGAAVASAATPPIVQGAQTPRDGFQMIFTAQLVWSAVTFALILTLPRAPAVPPSATASQPLPLSEMLPNIKVLLRNRNYCIFNVLSGLALMTAWTFSGMVAEYSKPFGVSEENAGVMAALFTILGAVGQFIVGKIVDRTGAYFAILLVFYGLALGFMSLLALLYALEVDGTVAGFVAVPALGAVFLATLPAMYEFLVELSYPVPVPVAVGVQMFISRIILSTAVNRGGSAILTDSPSKDDSLTFLLTYQMIFAVCVAMLFFVKNDCRRRRAEQSLVDERNHLVSSLPDGVGAPLNCHPVRRSSGIGSGLDASPNAPQ